MLFFLAVEGGFWEDFKTNIKTGRKDAFPISENRPSFGELLWSSPGGGNQDSGVNERDLQSSSSLTPPRRSAISRSRPSWSSQGLPERAYSSRAANRSWSSSALNFSSEAVSPESTSSCLIALRAMAIILTIRRHPCQQRR